MNDYQLADGVLTVAPGTAYIRSQQFCQRDDFYKVIIPDGVGFMEDECFTECSKLEEVVLPEGLINIGPAAFADCPKLSSINIPSTVKSVDSGAFLFCESLRQVALPRGLETVSEFSFQNTGLEAVTVPENVRIIDDCAFFSCESLERADVLGKDTVIGPDAFGSNYRLIRGYIAPGYPAITDSASELLYTLLWLTCSERHRKAVSQRAREYIRGREELIMERILKADNIPAMTGLASEKLLYPEVIDSGLRQALTEGKTELAALLLKAKNSCISTDEEFAL